MYSLPTIGLVGSGRAAVALGTALHQRGHRVAAVHGRNHQTASALAAALDAPQVETPLAVVTTADVTLLAVPDSAIVRVAAGVAAAGVGLRGCVVLHLSASHDRHVLASLRQCAARVGAFHPLAPLAALDSGTAASRLSGSLALIDADDGVFELLSALARGLHMTPVSIAAGQRRRYHAAAVLAAAGTVALQVESARLLVSTGIDSETARAGVTALMRGALDNVAAAPDGVSALTGPVVRDDSDTVCGHLEALHDLPAVQQLYLALLRTTVALYGAAASPRVASVAADPTVVCGATCGSVV